MRPQVRACISIWSSKYFSSKCSSVVARTQVMPGVVKLEEGNFSSEVDGAANLLHSGAVVALPTDTLYGLASLAQHASSVDEIYKVKKRNPAKPLAVCVGEVNDIYKWAHVTVPQELLQDLLPGPVTLIFRRTEALNKDLNPDTNLIGIRIPASEFVQRVTLACGAPLALTSANISHHQSPLAVEEFKEIWNEVACVYDGGPISAKIYNGRSNHVKECALACQNGGSDLSNCLGGINSCEQCVSQLSSINYARAGSTVINLSEKGYYTVVRDGIALKNTLDVLHSYCLKSAL